MIRYFAKHPTAANLLMLIFLVIGVFSARGLRRETLPDHAPVEIEIRVVQAGATAEEVEEAICQRVEDALDGVRFVAEMRSEAREGVGVVTVEMENGGDYTSFKDEIDTEVTAIDDFPEDVEDPIITQLHTTDPVLALLVVTAAGAADWAGIVYFLMGPAHAVNGFYAGNRAEQIRESLESAGGSD